MFALICNTLQRDKRTTVVLTSRPIFRNSSKRVYAYAAPAINRKDRTHACLRKHCYLISILRFSSKQLVIYDLVLANVNLILLAVHLEHNTTETENKRDEMLLSV